LSSHSQSISFATHCHRSRCFGLTHFDWLLQHLFAQSAANVFQVHVGMVERAQRMVARTSAFVYLDLKEAIVKVSVFDLQAREKEMPLLSWGPVHFRLVRNLFSL